MAALHTSLKSLSPTAFSNIPTAPDELDSYLSSLFSDCQTILESVPISPADESHHARSRSQTSSSIASLASSASEMSISAARSPEPSPEVKALQKEWGKPIKLSAKENPLEVSVHKTSGKDGRGAWFARRSVHEGLGFARFKRGLQKEFPESLEVGGGKPGEGNIRGIGGERKVEDIGVKGRGRVQVWQLSAQFPGPTTPRDFITLLITSSRALVDHDPNHGGEGVAEIQPRHYMIISRPCEHPETPQRSGFIRGQYESVEFIREIITKPGKKPSPSSTATGLATNSQGPQSEEDLEKHGLNKNSQKTHTFPTRHDNHSAEELPEHGHLRRPTSDISQTHEAEIARKRGVTVGTAQEAEHAHDEHGEHYDPEENPVEWIMITRSDPGGSVPRFMVERGTPASIVADASKFLNWACQKHDVPEDVTTPSSEFPPQRPPRRDRLQSFSSWQANGTLAGITPVEGGGDKEAFPNVEDTTPSEASNPMSPTVSVKSEPTPLASGEHIGIVAGATGAFAAAVEAYAPKFVTDHLPPGMSTPKASASSPALLATHEESHLSNASTLNANEATHEDDDDAASDISSLSWASAESHVTPSASNNQSISSLSSPEKDRTEESLAKSKDPVAKEHANFEKRRMTLNKKLDEVRTKYGTEDQAKIDKVKKAEEKHRKEMEKEEERYKKNLAKLHERKTKESKRAEEKEKYAREKDELNRMKTQRDEAVKKVAVLERQVDLLAKQVGDLQRENTGLVARLGNSSSSQSSGNGAGPAGVERSRDVQRLLSEEVAVRPRSRSSSLRRVKEAAASGEGV